MPRLNWGCILGALASLATWAWLVWVGWLVGHR
jgi:hypothetical protein